MAKSVQTGHVMHENFVFNGKLREIRNTHENEIANEHTEKLENGNSLVELDKCITQKPGRFICRGPYNHVVHLYAETGHLIWIDPYSSMRVLFTYGDTKCDFLCYLEPEVAGVAITHLQDELSLSTQNPLRSIPSMHTGRCSSAAGSTGTRHSCLRTVLNPYSYAVDSTDGYCLFELRSLTDVQLRDIKEPINRPFKLNFQLVL